jgi:hypothetical protein
MTTQHTTLSNPADLLGGSFGFLLAHEHAQHASLSNPADTSAEYWHARMERLASGRLLGRFFAGCRSRLREVANLGGCSAS